MEGSKKNRAIILVLALLTIIFFIGTVSSCSNLYRAKLARDKEMVSRLDLEEKINKLTQEKTATENKLNSFINSLTQELEKEKAAHEATKKELLQEQLISQSLKDELQKVSELKGKLEEEIEALSTAKSAKPKK